MTDKYNKKSGDDEYQFPQEEYVAGEQEHDTSGAASHDSNDVTDESNAEPVKGKFSDILERFPFLQNKRVVTVVIVAVVALIGFKIMGPSHEVKQVKKTQTISAQQQRQDMLMSKYNRLSQDASKNQDTVGQLQSQVSGLRGALNTSVQNSETMKSAVVALAQQVRHLSQEVKADNAKPKKHNKYPLTPIITYHLLALESGRAWIMGSNGISNSVKVGTKIKHYGTVKAIETNTGKVLTTSGKVITYNADGN